MKKIFLSLLAFTTISNAILIGTSKKQKDETLLLSNYYINFQSDTIKDSNGNQILGNYGWDEKTYALKPAYYKDNFIYTLTLPYRKVSRDFTNEEVQGLFDIEVGVGYFIPNDFGDIVFYSNLILPTGKYESNKPNVYYGTIPALQISANRYELQESLNLFKIAFPFLIDASIIYNHRFKDRDTKVDNGYMLGYESTASFIFSKNFFAGPAIYYKKYNKEYAVDKDKGSSKYQIGFDALYKFANEDSLTFEYVKDYAVKNRAEGKRYTLRYVYKF